MNIQEILSLSEDQWLTELQVDPVTRNIKENIDYFEGKHPILTDPSRADYFIDKFEEDPSTGEKIAGKPEQVKRTKLVINYQQQIVETAVGMCVGAPVTLTLNSGDEPGHREAFEILVDQWRNKARLDTFSVKMAKALFVESKCAELYFHDGGDTEGDIKVMLLSKDNGDDIWAHFDDDKKMDALTRVYTKRMIVGSKPEDVEVTQIWTAESRWEKQGDGAWEQTTNPYEKLQIVYYDQEKPEFHLVTDLISKQEYVRSQNSDVNKRVGSPSVVVDGELVGPPEVGQDVKVWTLKNGTDIDGKPVKSSVSYLQSANAPEAIKMELDDYKQDMYKLTWPDLSFLRESIKTGSLSGVAIKLMFTDSFVKIGLKKAIFEDFSRRVSILKRMLAVAQGGVFDELNISVTFNSILPENTAEIADYLAVAVQNGITSKSQAIGMLNFNDGNPNIADEILKEEGREIGGIA